MDSNELYDTASQIYLRMYQGQKVVFWVGFEMFLSEWIGTHVLTSSERQHIRAVLSDRFHIQWA